MWMIRVPPPMLFDRTERTPLPPMRGLRDCFPARAIAGPAVRLSCSTIQGMLPRKVAGRPLREVMGEGGLPPSPVFLNVHPGQQARVSRTRGWPPRWRTRPIAESRECDPKRADRCGHGRLPGPHRGPGASVKGHPRCRPAGGPCCERDDAAGVEPAASLLCGQDPGVRRGRCGCAGEGLDPRERSARCPVARHENYGPRYPLRRRPPAGLGNSPTAAPILQGRGQGGRR